MKKKEFITLGKIPSYFRRFFFHLIRNNYLLWIALFVCIVIACTKNYSANELLTKIFILIIFFFLLALCPTIIHTKIYITNILVDKNIITIKYKCFWENANIKLELDNLKVSYEILFVSDKNFSRITFGQKNGGYNNKIMLTQYLINSWSNKETLLQFCNFLKENNIKTKNFDYLEEQLKKNQKFIP